MRLGADFFNRNTITVAQALLGKYLVRKKGTRVTAVRITEVEAYKGREDLACHASKGITPRTRVLFGPPGYTYVYLIYGMYHCLNFVSEKEGYPAAVLIRGVDVPGGDGPGKVCRILELTRDQNNLPPGNSEIWIEDRGDVVHKKRIMKTKRVGVEYAGPWADKLWRFVLQ